VNPSWFAQATPGQAAAGSGTSNGHAAQAPVQAGGTHYSVPPILTNDAGLCWQAPTVAFRSTYAAHGYHVCVECSLSLRNAPIQSAARPRK
jgi:hypothetical protein